MTTAEVTADGLKKVVADGVSEAEAAKKVAARAAKKEKKVAARAEKDRKAEMDKAAVRALKASGLNVPDRSTSAGKRPGGGSTANVNLNKPQTMRLSKMILAIGAGTWEEAPLERDFAQATQALFLHDDHEQGVSATLPTTRSGFARVTAEGAFNFGQGGDKVAFRSWAARMADAEDGVTAAGMIGDPTLIHAARDAAEGLIGSGGALVPPEYLQQMYTLSIQTSVAFANLPGVDRLPVKSNMIIFPRETVMPATAAYAEAGVIAPTDPTFGQQTILIKKQAGLNRYSNEMLADASPEYEALLTKTLTRSVSLLQDFEFMEGDGTGTHVLGLRHYPGLTASDAYGDASEGWAWGTTATAAVIAVGLGAGVEGPMRMLANARGHGWEPNAYLMHPDVMNRALALCKDANGRFLLESIGGVFGAPIPVPNIGALPTQITYVNPPWKAMLLGCPVYMSAQIPQTETYGDSADCTHVYAGDWNFAHILERQAIEMARSDQILFTTDQTAVRVSTRSAIVLLAPGAFLCQLGVRATTLDTNE